jgi:CDGSH iron-sulfur domain-containing protein 3
VTRLVFSDPQVRPRRNRARIETQSKIQDEEFFMARMIRHEKNAPYEVPEGTELPIYICACGLSKNKPFCDGSHKKTRDENPTDVYLYDDMSRVRVKTEY